MSNRLFITIPDPCYPEYEIYLYPSQYPQMDILNSSLISQTEVQGISQRRKKADDIWSGEFMWDALTKDELLTIEEFLFDHAWIVDNFWMPVIDTTYLIEDVRQDLLDYVYSVDTCKRLSESPSQQYLLMNKHYNYEQRTIEDINTVDNEIILYPTATRLSYAMLGDNSQAPWYEDYNGDWFPLNLFFLYKFQLDEMPDFPRKPNAFDGYTYRYSLTLKFKQDLIIQDLDEVTP